MTKRLLLASLLFLSLYVPVHAGIVLQAMVVEVQNGNTLIAINQGRRVTVILEAVDAPQKGHPFDAIATQHLSNFVLGKMVAVEYSAIGANSTLIGKVFVNNLDVGQQMIRDGAARFDKKRERNLTAGDRMAYLESEGAARNEKRGVWQDGVVWPETTAAPKVAETQTGPTGGAASDDPFRRVTYDELARKASSKPAPAPAELRWPMFSPTGADFSLRIPPGGRGVPFEITLPTSEVLRASMYVVQHPNVEYTALWAVGPNHKANMSVMLERSMDVLSGALKTSGYPCDFSKGEEVVINGYRGLQYEFKGCIFKGGVRQFHKVEGNDLRVYAVAVVSTDEKTAVIEDFLNSFTINR